MRQVDGFFADLENLYDGGHITLTEIDYNWGSSMRVRRALIGDALARARVLEGEGGSPGRAAHPAHRGARAEARRPADRDRRLEPDLVAR